MKIAVSGSSSGIGAACVELFLDTGATTFGIDVVRHRRPTRDRFVDIQCDLATKEARRQAIEELTTRANGHLDGIVTCAGLAGLPGRPGSLLASLNYFGTVSLLEGCRPLLAGHPSAAIAISSNSTTIQPNVPEDVVAACLLGDETRARELADHHGSLDTYPATKIAVAHWIRRHAVKEPWIGSTICLNAIAPGLIETPLAKEQRSDPVVGPLIELFPIPASRSGNPQEIAHFVHYLMGPHGRFFCGSVLFLDGGSDALLRTNDWPAAWKP